MRRKIILTYPHGNSDYQVVGAINTTIHRIGDVLTQRDADELCENPRFEVVIKNKETAE